MDPKLLNLNPKKNILFLTLIVITCFSILDTQAQNQNPIAVCQDFTAQLNSNGNITIEVSDIDNGSSDPDGDILTLSINPNTFDCNALGSPQIVTLTVDDGNGGVSSCTATVTIEDNETPTIFCPANITIGNIAGTCEGSIDFEIVGMFAAVGDYVGNGGDRGALVRLNTTTGSGTVQGTPMQGRSLLGLAQSNTGVVYATTDGREFITIEPFDGRLISTITIHNSPIWDLALDPVTDILYGMQTVNNVTNTLVIIDKTTGVVTPIGSPIPSEEATELTIGFAPDGTLYGLQSDNFVNDGSNLLVIDPTTGSIINEIVLSTHLGAGGLGVDENGLIYITECCNGGSPLSNMLWTIDPSNGNTTQIGSFGGGRIVQDIAFMKLGAIATDNCNNIASLTYSPASGSTLPIGTSTITATATDASGNSTSCTFDVTVEDREAPNIACPANIVANSDASICGAIVDLTEQPVVSDICSAPENITVTQTGGPTLGNVFPIGFSEVELTATDENGNSTSCTFIVEVVDVENPVFTSSDITINSDSGSCDAIVTFNTPQPIDNCPLPPTSVPGFSSLGSYNGSTYFISDATFRPYDAFDDANNNGYKMITINDINENFHIQNVVNAFFGMPTNVLIGGFKNQDNSISWQDLDTSTFANWDDGQPFFFPHIEILGTNGRWNSVNTFVEFRHYIIEFDGSEVSQTSGPSSGSAFPIGDTLIEFSYTDGGGNTAVNSFNVTVVDNEAPVIFCPQNQSVTADQSSMTYQLPDYFAIGEVSVTDNCTSIFTNFTQNPQPGSELSSGTHTINFTVLDEYNNASNCSFELTVDNSTLGLESPNMLGDIKLYPNPVKDILTIYNPASLELNVIQIYDLSGRQVKEVSLYTSRALEMINISDLRPSAYFAIIKGMQGQVIKKIIKE